MCICIDRYNMTGTMGSVENTEAGVAKVNFTSIFFSSFES